MTVGFKNQQKKWLEIAEVCKPTLFRGKKPPLQIVAPVEDAAAFQNWRMQPLGPAGAFFEQSLHEGDALVLDLGEHIVGYVHFSLALLGKAMGGPLRLKFIFGEVPAEIATPFDPYRGALSRAWLQDEILTLDTLPQTVRLPRRYAFRYLKIEVLACSFDYRVRFAELFCETVSSMPPDIDAYGREQIPPDLQEIDRTALRTLRNCLQTVPEDGPKRDRRLWLADSPLMAQVIYHTFRNYDIYKRCLHLFAGLAHEDGRIPACVYERPHPHKGEEFILDFAVMFGSYLRDYARHSNDWETAERLWPVALRQLDFALEYLDKSGRFQDRGKWWVFIDWEPQLEKQAAMQGLLMYAFQQIVLLAQALKRAPETAHLTKTLAKMRQTARQLRSPEPPHFFISGKDRQISWAAQVWMILAEVVPPEEGAEILQKLLTHPAAVKPATPFIYHYTVEAMLRCGMKTEAVNLLKSYWGQIIAFGATTFWEIFDPADHLRSPYGNHLVNSYCHSWSCTPAYLIRRYLI